MKTAGLPKGKERQSGRYAYGKDKNQLNRPTLEFGIRSLALFLSLSLGLPESLFALRKQQQEDPSQVSGLEEVLKNPAKAIYPSAGSEEASIWPTTESLALLHSDPIFTLVAEGGFGDFIYVHSLIEAFMAKKAQPILLVTGGRERVENALSRWKGIAGGQMVASDVWLEDDATGRILVYPATFWQSEQIPWDALPELDSGRRRIPHLIQHYSQVQKTWPDQVSERVVTRLKKYYPPPVVLWGYNAPNNPYGGFLESNQGVFVNLYQTPPASQKPAEEEPNAIHTGNVFSPALRRVIEGLKIRPLEERRLEALRRIHTKVTALGSEAQRTLLEHSYWVYRYTSQGGHSDELGIFLDALRLSGFSSVTVFTFLGNNPRRDYYPSDFWIPHQDLVSFLKQQSDVRFLDLTDLFGSGGRVGAPFLFVNLPDSIGVETSRWLMGSSDFAVVASHNSVMETMAMAVESESTEGVGPPVMVNFPTFSDDRQLIRDLLVQTGASEITRRIIENYYGIRERPPSIASRQDAVISLARGMTDPGVRSAFRTDLARMARAAFLRTQNPKDLNLIERLATAMATLDATVGRGTSVQEALAGVVPKTTEASLVRAYQHALGAGLEERTKGQISSGMEEVSPTAIEKSLATADKYIVSEPTAEMDPDLGLFGMGDLRVAGIPNRVKELLKRRINPGLVSVRVPRLQGQLRFDVSEIWESFKAGSNEIVLIETNRHPFIAAELKSTDLARAGFFRVDDKPLPKGAYHVSVQLAWARDGEASKDSLQVHLPKVFLEPEARLEDADLITLILVETMVKWAWRAAVENGMPVEKATIWSRNFRRKLEKPNGPLGRLGFAKGLRRFYGSGGFREAQELEWTARLTRDTAGYPTEPGLISVLTYAPDRIVDFLELLNELADLSQQGEIRFSEDLMPHAEDVFPVVRNSLAAAFVKNRVPSEILQGFTWPEYEVAGSPYSTFTPSELGFGDRLIGISKGVLGRKTREAAGGELLRDKIRLWKENPFLAKRTSGELREMFWRNLLYSHLNLEHAHLLDYGLMEMMAFDSTEKREALTEYQDFLERVTSFLDERLLHGSVDQPLSSEEVGLLQSDLLEFAEDSAEDTLTYQAARSMLRRVIPLVLNWAIHEELTLWDTTQIFLWLKLLLLASQNPDDTIEQVSATNTTEFLLKAEHFLRTRLEFLTQKEPARGEVRFFRQLLRELIWTREQHARTGHFPRSGTYSGLEERHVAMTVDLAVRHAMAAVGEAVQDRPGVVVIDAEMFGRTAGLEELLKRIPLENRFIVIGASASVIEIVANNPKIRIASTIKEAVPIILSLPSAGQVHVLGTLPFYQALQRDLVAFAVQVYPIDSRLGLKALLVAAGVPEGVLQQIDWTSIESALASLEAA